MHACMRWSHWTGWVARTLFWFSTHSSFANSKANFEHNLPRNRNPAEQCQWLTHYHHHIIVHLLNHALIFIHIHSLTMAILSQKLPRPNTKVRSTTSWTTTTILPLNYPFPTTNSYTVPTSKLYFARSLNSLTIVTKTTTAKHESTLYHVLNNYDKTTTELPLPNHELRHSAYLPNCTSRTHSTHSLNSLTMVL